MANTCFHNIYVGSETGLLKGVHVEKTAWNNLNSVEKVDKENEISCICWGNDPETEVCFGTKSRLIQSYDTVTGTWGDNIQCPGGSGRLVGLSKYQGNFLTAVESGLVKLWMEDEESRVELEAGDRLCCMRHSKHGPHLAATGGKENPLKLWDLNRPETPVFTAKNVRNDWLNLRVPVWVLGIEFVPDSPQIITCTGHHQVRLYDPSTSQRRPVLSTEFDEFPITAISLRPDRRQVVVGNTQGKMALMDLRKGQMVSCYKGFAGSIRAIQCHPTMPLVASCGLDRFLRVHEIDTGNMISKIYLKSRLNCLLFATKWSPDVKNKESSKPTPDTCKTVLEADPEGDSGNEDELWSKMEAVKTKTVSKRKSQGLKQNVELSEKKIKTEKRTKPNRRKKKSNV